MIFHTVNVKCPTECKALAGIVFKGTVNNESANGIIPANCGTDSGAKYAHKSAMPQLMQISVTAYDIC
jgi:hypothetical protein